MSDVLYRGWQGDEKDRKRTVSQHFEDARRNYDLARNDPHNALYNAGRADICLCAPEDALALGPSVDGVLIQGRNYVRRCCFYIGRMPS
jgi:hypothetical protein